MLENMTQQRSDFHAMPLGEVFTALETRTQGLTATEVNERILRFGKNEIRKIKGKPLIVKFLANFTHLMAVLLWVGGIAAFIARMPQLGIAVWAVILINGVFSFWQEFRAEKATEALQKLLPTYTRVIRESEEKKILAEDLVPGDIILLAEGDHISADARLINQAELRCDQSTLTGESRPVEKAVETVKKANLSFTELPNLVFAGTNVAYGTGKAVVYATGMNTEFGKIANLTQEMHEDLSPLQKEIKTVTRTVTLIAVGAGILFFILAVLFTRITFAESFIFSIGMIVAFVPEGLLPTVTLALAMATQRMAKRNALIKKLSAVETLGCTTVICTDKTGTLTQNEMTVKSIWLPAIEDEVKGFSLQVTGTGYAPEGEIRHEGRRLLAPQNKNLKQLLRAAGLCNNAKLVPPSRAEDAEEKEKRWSVLGDPTEASLLVAAAEGGVDLEDEEGFSPRVREIPFDSRRKRMTTIHRLQETSRFAVPRRGTKSEIAYVKGAPKEVLDLCVSVFANGEALKLSAELREKVMSANDEMARAGLRVLAMAQRALPADTTKYDIENIEKDLTFLGLVAMMDPPRVEVAEAVSKCRTAGIRVIMITGDYGLTAESIARKIGIIETRHARIITGFNLESMSEDELKSALKEEVIFARVAPEHKLRVVSALQELGNVVAVTGDGVNDSPALKKADIGVAMGITGSDVAKEAADMILTDDNFASIVNAIEEGRSVYANIKKFTTYIFTSNTPEIVPFVLNVMSQGRIPIALNVMHVLAIDLGTDIIPALGLGAEKPEPGLMNNSPRNLKDHVIEKNMLIRAYSYLGLTQAAVSMLAFYFYYWTNGYAGKWIDLPGDGAIYAAATAMALGAVVATQIGNLFTQRTEKTSIFRIPLFNNKMIWLGIVSEVAIIIAIVYVPFLNRFIGTGPFEAKYWLFLLAFAPILIIPDEIVKFFKRRKEKKLGGAE